MATVSKTFTAAGTSGTLTVKSGQTVTYFATDTSFVGVVYFEKSTSGGMAWDTVEHATDSGLTGGVVKNDGSGAAWFRFRVAQNGGSAVSGSLACSVSDAVDVLFEYKNPAGEVVFRITDDGVETSKITATSADLPASGGTTTGVTFTASGGTFDSPPDLVYAAAPAVSVNGVDVAFPGACVSSITNVGNNTATDVSFDGMVAFTGATTDFNTPSSAVTTLAFPDLRVMTQNSFFTFGSDVENLDLSALEYAMKGIAPVATEGLSGSLIDIDLSAIKYLGSSGQNGSLFFKADNFTPPGTLTNINIGNSLKNAAGIVFIQGQPLIQECVDNLLVSFAALDGTNGTVVYSNKNFYIFGTSCAAPSAIGVAAKAVLEARGCTVVVN